MLCLKEQFFLTLDSPLLALPVGDHVKWQGRECAQLKGNCGIRLAFSLFGFLAGLPICQQQISDTGRLWGKCSAGLQHCCVFGLVIILLKMSLFSGSSVLPGAVWQTYSSFLLWRTASQTNLLFNLLYLFCVCVLILIQILVCIFQVFSCFLCRFS